MRILSISLYNENDELLRTVNLTNNELFLVYGNVKKPKDKKKTINSIGKTLFLKMCNYILGSKCDSELTKSVIANYYIISEISDSHNCNHKVKRALNQKSITVDEIEIQLDSYIEIYNIDRRLLSRQVRLYPKGSLLGYNKTPTQADYVEFLEILGLKDLSERTNEYYELRKVIDNLSKTMSELLKFLNISENEIRQELFMNEKTLKEIEEQVIDNSKRIKNLKMIENAEELQNNYSQIDDELKTILYKISKVNSERKALDSFLKKSEDNNLSISNVAKIFEAAKFEVPEIVVKKIEEVQKFYSDVIEDRIVNIKNKMNELNKTSEELYKKRDILKQKIDEIGAKISNNDWYKSAINSLQDLNKKYSDCKYKQGQLAQIKEVYGEIKNRDDDIRRLYYTISNVTKGYEQIIKKFKEFVFMVVKDIYDNDVSAYFDIYNSTYRKNAIPVHVDLNVSGETGEGILEVKKNIIDILLFNFNLNSDTLILDSSCFNGIDPRQVSGLLNVIDRICKDKKKQAIISINKYQVVDDYVKDKSDFLLELSEEDKLLKISY